MDQLSKEILDIESSIGERLRKGIRIYLETEDLPSIDKQSFRESLRQRAVSNAKWELRCFESDSRKGEYEYPGSFHGGAEENEFYGHLGKLLSEMLIFDIKIEEIHSDLIEKISEGLTLYHSVSVLQYVEELSNHKMVNFDSKPSQYYMNKIHCHLDNARMNIKKCCSISYKELKEIAAKYEEARLEILFQSEEYIEEQILELQTSLRSIQNNKTKIV